MFAWNADLRAVLVIECKSIVADLQDLIATMDRKRRLAADITLEELAWRPAVIGSVLVLPDRSAARQGPNRSRNRPHGA